MATTNNSGIGAPRPIVASATSGLAAAMGIGRFVYTPILPVMAKAVGVSAGESALVATSNYAGYLVAAIVLSLRPRWRGRAMIRTLTASLVVSEAAMAATTNVEVWAALRFIAGASSAGLFISCVGAVTALVASKTVSPVMAAVAFSGVGVGIGLTGLLALATEDNATWQQMWLGSSVLTALLLLPLWFSAQPRSVEKAARTKDIVSTKGGGRPRSKIAMALMATYFLEGLGYIVVGTFLVAAVGDAKTSTGPTVWAIVGIAAVPATLLWAALARRVGWPIALAIALGVQTLGTILPVLDGSSITAIVTAALFGATFMGICMLTMECGQSLIGPNSAAPLTAVYGLGQMLGPLMVAPVIGDGYGVAFTIAFVVLACATVVSALIARNTLPRK